MADISFTPLCYAFSRLDATEPPTPCTPCTKEVQRAKRAQHASHAPTSVAGCCLCNVKNIVAKRHQRATSSGSSQEPSTPIKENRSSGYKVPVPTTPFNEDIETDAFEFFPELQQPFSALRDDSSAYQTAAAEADEAKRFSELHGRRSYGSPVNRQDMILWALKQGKYEWRRTPTRPKQSSALLGQSQTVSDDCGSPMHLDW